MLSRMPFVPLNVRLPDALACAVAMDRERITAGRVLRARSNDRRALHEVRLLRADPAGVVLDPESQFPERDAGRRGDGLHPLHAVPPDAHADPLENRADERSTADQREPRAQESHRVEWWRDESGSLFDWDSPLMAHTPIVIHTVQQHIDYGYTVSAYCRRCRKNAEVDLHSAGRERLRGPAAAGAEAGMPETAARASS